MPDMLRYATFFAPRLLLLPDATRYAALLPPPIPFRHDASPCFVYAADIARCLCYCMLPPKDGCRCLRRLRQHAMRHLPRLMPPRYARDARRALPLRHDTPRYAAAAAYAMIIAAMPLCRQHVFRYCRFDAPS